MSNAKGSGKDNKLTQPQKVTAQSRSETNAISTQDYRTLVQKAVAMPASAVRAAMASTIAGAAAARVAYDVLSRLLNLVESGVVLDQALLKTTKAALQTAHAGDTILYRNIGKVIAQITTLNDVLTRIVSYKRTYTEVARSTDLPAKTLTKAPRQDTSLGTDTRVKTVGKNINTTYASGRWTDPGELTIGAGLFDQDLVFGFPTNYVEGVTFNDRISKVVGFNRTYTEIARSTDSKLTTASKILPTPASGTLVTGDVLSYDGYGVAAMENLLLFPQDFTNETANGWSSAGFRGLDITSTAELAPDGSRTATKFVFKSQYDMFQRLGLKLTSGQYYTVSVYAKADLYVRYLAIVAADSGNAFANFDLINGSFAGGLSLYSNSITPAANGFYRCSITFLATTTNHNIGFWMGGYQGLIWPREQTVSMTLWGPKVELGTTLTAYQPVGYSSLQNKNLLYYTEELGNGYWTLTETTASADSAVAPDGYSLADKIIGNNGITTRKSVYQGLYATAGITYTYSVYLKQAGFTNATIWLDTANISEGAYYGAACLINLTNGTRSGGTPTATTVVDVGNGWYRCSVTGTPTVSGSWNVQLSLGDPNGSGTATGNGVNGVYAWGAQFEQGSSATTYRRNKLVGQSATSLVDLGINNNVGTLQGTTLPVYNPAGYYTFTAANLNQISSEVLYTSPGPQVFSVAVAFRTTTTQSGKLIGYQNIQTGMTSTQYDRHLVIGTDGKVRFGLYPGIVTELPTPTALNDGQWHYVVGTYSSGTMTLYVDGLKVNSRSSNTPQAFTGYWVVGSGNTAGWTNSGNQYYTGDIAKAEVYTTALSANQVLTQYNLLANRLGLLQRSADPISIVDTKSAVLEKPKTEIVNLAELKRLNLGKFFEEISRASDSDKITFTKRVSDFVSAIHSAHIDLGFTNSEVNISSVADALTKLTSFVRTYQDIARGTDVAKRTLSKPRAETPRATDSLSRLVSFGRSRPETARASEALSRLVSFNRTRTETARGTDAPAKYLTKSPFLDTYKAIDSSRRTLSKRPADTSGAGDSFSKLVSFNRSFSSTATSTTSVDVFSSVKNYNRLRTETARSTDVFAKVVTFIRTRPETTRAADIFTKLVTYNRSKVDTSRATDVFVKVVTYNRSKVDTSRATDVFVKVVTYRRLPADTSRAMDFITAKTITKRLSEIIRVSDYGYPSFHNKPGSLPPADSQKARDFFVKLVSFIRSFSDTAAAQDSRKNTIRKTGGSTYSIWSDFNELTVDYDTTQTYDPRKLEILQPVDAIGKRLSKIANKTATYYYDARPITDYNDLTFSRVSNNMSDEVMTALAKNIQWYYLAAELQLIVFGSSAGNPLVSSFLTSIASDGYSYGNLNKSNGITGTDVTLAQSLDGYYNGPTISVSLYPTLTTAINRANTIVVPALYKWLVLKSDSSGATIDDSTIASIFYDPNLIFDQDQFLTYTGTYQDDTERALISDAVIKVAQFVRSKAETAAASDTTGRYIARTVGDIKSKVFNDFAELFYVSETYSNLGGVGGIVSITNNYPLFGVSIIDGGANYTVGQQFTIPVNGADCSFSVASINGSGTILTITTPTGTPARLPLNTSYFTDYADLTLGQGSLDQDLAQYNALTYTLPGPDTIRVGPQSFETRRNVWNQDMLFTLTERADGDKVSYTDSSSRQFTKEARRYLPQGVFEDFAELSFGLGPFDQELSQYLNKLWPESASAIDISSRATLGPTKRNRDTFNSTDAKALSLTKGPRADTAGFSDNIRSATTGLGISKSVGNWANRTWRDYAEISGSAFSALAEMPVDYEGRYELIITPDTVGKTITKPLHFPYYVWRDFNELSFGTTRDEELILTWFRDDASDISRMMDRETKEITKGNIEILSIPDTFPKTMSKGVGNTTQNDAIISNPEYIPYFSWFDELLAPQYPDYKIDRLTVSETRGNYISKTILGPGPINRYIDTNIDTVSFDETTVTFGYTGSTNNPFPDTKFVNYFDELIASEFEESYRTPYGSDSSFASDAFSRLVTFTRTFNEDIRANDYFLLSKNNEAYTNEYLPVISKTAKAGDAIRSATYGFIVSKQVGDVKSAISVWSDFLELQYDFELAQYYDDPQGSRLDTSKSLDSSSRQFSKIGGTPYTIINVYDEDIFYDTYLQQTFAKDYITEIIIPSDFSTKTIQQKKTEVLTSTETIGKYIEKFGIGESVIEELTTYSPLYLNYLSDIEESLWVDGRYIARIGPPPRRTDIARGSDIISNKRYDKQAGMSPVLKWYSNFDYIYNDETNVTEGTRADRENGFPQTVFRSYFEAEIWGDVLEDFFVTSIRTENLSVIDQIFIRCLWGRILPQIATTQDALGKGLSKPKSDTNSTADSKTLTLTKPAGTMFTVWQDYNELVVGQDLDQNYNDVRFEYLITIDNFVKTYSKRISEIQRATDVRVKTINKPISETQLARETFGRYFTKPQVGDSTLTAYYDTNEIYSFDETLFSYGLTRTTRFDIARPVDSLVKNYNVTPGKYRTNIWADYLDLDYNLELANYWPPYVTEIISNTDSATKRLNKGNADISRPIDTGFVRKFDSNAYVIDTSLYFAEDYTSDGVTTSTF